MVRTKSVQTPIERDEDGLRILVARGRGRGLPNDRYNVWMANLGPSEELRDAILSGRISWAEYSRRYLLELREGGGIDGRNKHIKNHGQKFTLRLLQHLASSHTVTLLCHCAEDELHCHRHLLKRYSTEKSDPWALWLFSNSNSGKDARCSRLWPRVSRRLATLFRALVTSWQAPALDLNYGLGERIQLMLQTSPVILQRTGRGAIGGLGSTEAAVKWRFLDEEREGVSVSIFPRIIFSFLQSSVRRGLAEDGVRAQTPLQIAKKLGPIDFDVEWVRS
ncbi:MAG: DUF488 family protein [Verrucomicrobiota bacterium]|nr:DUF488 family protein [Verrucomicrobiota bacterium]